MAWGWTVKMAWGWTGNKPVMAFFSIDTYIDGLVQDCSISIANALEILQSCTKPLIYACYSALMCSPCVNSPLG